MFGGYLKLEEGGGIPLVVRSCIEQVDKRGNVQCLANDSPTKTSKTGLDVVGIYRLSGQTTSIQKYKNQFNTSK